MPSNPNSDGDKLDGKDLLDGEDAVPLDAEINWKKTPENRYVWVEQMATPVDQSGQPIAPVAVNSSGQVIFPYYTAGEEGSTTDPLKSHLWDTTTRQWTNLPHSGSQAIEIEPGLTFTADDQAGGFVDINDAGTISALARGGQSSPYTSIVGAHVMSGTQAAMIWEKFGTPSAYGPPKYSIYHPTHPIISCPACGPDFRNTCWSELDITAHAGSRYLWRNWRVPGGRIGIDGSINLCANISGSTYNFSPVWLLRDGVTTSPLLDLVIKHLGASQADYLTQLGNGTAFAGAILDKTRALFVETYGGTSASNLWLKDGVNVELIASIAPPLWTDQTDIIHAPSKKNDNTERLWIAAGTKVLLEKLAGGSGANRWHNPTSMAEGALRLNAQGIAITRGQPSVTTLIPPKLWSNGKYTNLNEVALKPTSVNITEAIDLASNGIILAQATENGVTKTGLLVPVEIEQQDYSAAQGIRFCRWLDGFFPWGTFNPDCANNDRDRFRVRIPAILPNLTKVRIKSTGLEGAIIEGNWQLKGGDGDYDVNLTQENGTLVSPWMLLVSDGDDDRVYNGKGTADNSTDDQTLHADFNSPIIVSLPEYGSVETVFHAQKALGHVTVDCFFLTPVQDSTGDPTVTVQQDVQQLISNQIGKMKEIYRQIGVEVVYGGVKGVGVPESWFDATLTPDEAADHLNPYECSSALNTIKRQSVPEEHIRIGFVDATLKVDAMDTGLVRGFTLSGHNGNIYFGYEGSVVSLAPNSRIKLGVTAHESGHVLDLDHTQEAARRWLMKDHDLFWNNDNLDSKRFQEGDFEIIRKKNSYYVPN